ncbi:unnamed protein product [Adineta steineri]|uniref:K Homology domain-containing protein n=1 Tax=Adineta steineri TaxID=433720 RepID=A0A815PLY4_9BILA|nr:unnamed protein product [Adineta steineri]
MINNSSSFQDAVARAKQIAQKLSASAPNVSGNTSLKRPNSEDDSFNKRPAITSPTQSSDIPTPVLRAQLVAQQINSQLGVKSSSTDSSLLPLSNQNTFQEDYKIPDKFVGLIIGKGGEQIIRLQAESGCKVQICQTRPEPVPGGPNPPDRLANLCGSREAIDRARRVMDDIIAKGKMAEGGPLGINPYSMGGTNIKSIDVMLPTAKCGLVIGKGGENIKRVCEEFGVKMYVAQETSEIDGIEHKPLKMTGEADKVERAKQYILDSLAKSGGIPLPNRSSTNSTNSTFTDYGSRAGSAPMSGPCNEATYHAPHEKAGIIIGKGGESIKEINRKSGAFVELDKAYVPAIGNSSDRVFKLRGTPDQIVVAQQLMYDKIINSPGGPGDTLTPAQFQQQFNLPLVGSNLTDSWSGNNDPYGHDTNGAAAALDPYSQWASAYGQWPTMNPYDTNATNNNSSAATDASAMSQMDPAWLAYYQSMSYYNMMQASMTGATSSGTSTPTTTTKATDSTATNNNTSTTPAINPTTGQPDYSQQWIEYYRSIGQNDVADQIMQQMKQPGSTATSTSDTSTTNSSSTDSTAAAQAAASAAAMMMSAGNPWGAYAQWNNGTNGVGSTTANTTNGSSSTTAPSS